MERVMPLWKESVWAGDKLGEGIGEAYLFSALPDCCSFFFDGRRLEDILCGEMPLIKYIDAEGSLSVQVHPCFDGEKRGKDELWIIDDVYEDCEVYIGFRRDVSLAEVRRSCENGSILSLMESVNVAKGDVIYIPGGTIHAARGISFFEVQHSLDVTYRLFDYGRERELQLDAGLTALNCCRFGWKQTNLDGMDRTFLSAIPFGIGNVDVDGICHPATVDDHVVVVLDGAVCYGKELLSKGDTMLLRKDDPPLFFGKGRLLFVSLDISEFLFDKYCKI